MFKKIIKWMPEIFQELFIYNYFIIVKYILFQFIRVYIMDIIIYIRILIIKISRNSYSRNGKIIYISMKLFLIIFGYLVTYG